MTIQNIIPSTYGDPKLSHKKLDNTIRSNYNNSIFSKMPKYSSSTSTAPKGLDTATKWSIGLAAATGATGIFSALATAGVFSSKKKDGKATPTEQELEELKNAKKDWNKANGADKEVAKQVFQKEISDAKELVRTNNDAIKVATDKIGVDANIISESDITIKQVGPKIADKESEITNFEADIKKYSEVPKDETTEAKVAREKNLATATTAIENARTELKALKKTFEAAENAKKAAVKEKKEAEDSITELNKENIKLGVQIKSDEEKLAKLDKKVDDQPQVVIEPKCDNTEEEITEPETQTQNLDTNTESKCDDTTITPETNTTANPFALTSTEENKIAVANSGLTLPKTQKTGLKGW